jgi:hypothetical protein
MTTLSRRAVLKLGTAGFAGSALPALASANETTCKPCGGLCNAALCIRAHQLLSLVCVLGGAKCPLIESSKARDVLQRLGSDPTTTIRLMSNADEIPHYTKLGPSVKVSQDPQEVLNRKRDLDVLQRLGLTPGDTRRARYLYELLFKRIETLKGICAHDTPGWEGCPLAKSGAYERVRAKGWKAVVYLRTDQEREQYRTRNVQLVE